MGRGRGKGRGRGGRKGNDSSNNIKKIIIITMANIIMPVMIKKHKQH